MRSIFLLIVLLLLISLKDLNKIMGKNPGYALGGIFILSTLIFTLILLVTRDIVQSSKKKKEEKEKKKDEEKSIAT